MSVWQQNPKDDIILIILNLKKVKRKITCIGDNMTDSFLFIGSCKPLSVAYSSKESLHLSFRGPSSQFVDCCVIGTTVRNSAA